MSDLISRQDAIDVLMFDEEMLRRVLDDMDVVGVERNKHEWGLGLIKSEIEDMKELPSAEPEQHLCRDCKWVKYYGNVDKNGNVNSYWHCMNWDGGTDEEGYCYEWESR